MRAYTLSRSFTFLMFLLMVTAIVASTARAENATGVSYPTVQIDDVDIIYREAGVELYKRDPDNPEFHLIDTGHFVLETHGQETADVMRDFLNRKVSSPSVAAR